LYGLEYGSLRTLVVRACTQEQPGSDPPPTLHFPTALSTAGPWKLSFKRFHAKKSLLPQTCFPYEFLQLTKDLVLPALPK
jgi:hypothetical protein